MAINLFGPYKIPFINSDLISVQPLSAPTGKLHYLDYTYIDKMKERRLKIEKLYEQIRLKQENRIV
jgi:hypothetical protein